MSQNTTIPSRPQLPAGFKKELRQKQSEQESRRVQIAPVGLGTDTIPPDDLVSFSEYLRSSKRVLALFGAGLSSASGIMTLRGASEFWKEYDTTEMCSPSGFSRDPSTVWQFYNYRRRQALKARPNLAHFAFAQLAKANPNFLAVTQNIDGLSPRAGHKWPQLEVLHGSLFDIRCTDSQCDYHETNFNDTICPALAVTEEYDIGDINTPLRDIQIAALPHCPKCKNSLLRPGVVWFGEALPRDVLNRIDGWLSNGKVDLMIVVGTAALVYPAAGYISRARKLGARVAIVNIERRTDQMKDGPSMEKGYDWFFHGNAAVIVPELLKCIIGETVMTE